ncbi:vascular cell adhesion protein 1-like [Gadus macrocephalus]|uniref:vascular cell adhesion protein 1-like n=1 Tax=Gadus macrocephalus TaxID=80720 RepID=UPI0028CB6881|nr:vascular cell adhesion protein 1-like [Gadus macrocephalus]
MDMLAFRLSFYLAVCMLEVVHESDACMPKGGCPIMITPSRIVVQYGSPLYADCSSCVNGSCKEMKWETPTGSTERLNNSNNGINKTIFRLNVDNATEWDMRPMCYELNNADCCIGLAVTLYKPPDNVSISFVNHTGPLLEGHQYTLQCRVQNVGPVQNLAVTFYKGDTMLGPVQSNRTSENTTATETFTSFSFNSSRGDDGVQYWCEAKLNLGQQGPPPVMMSERLTTTVYFKPKTGQGSTLDPISITVGEPFQLNCKAHSNPSPAYSWTGPDNTTVGNGSDFSVHSAGFEHKGLYVCAASNSQGSTTVTFNVDVGVDWLPIIAGVSALLLVICAVVGVFVYYTYYKKTKMGQYQVRLLGVAK